MHKNEVWYYCYLTNSHRECIFSVPQDADGGPDTFGNTFYNVDRPLGQSLFCLLELLEQLLSSSEILGAESKAGEAVFTFPDEILYRYFERTEYGYNSLKSFLKLHLKDPFVDVRDVRHEAKTYRTFIDTCERSKAPCTNKDLLVFYHDGRNNQNRHGVYRNWLNLIPAIMVPLDLKAYLNDSMRAGSPESMIEIIANMYDDVSFHELEERFKPYMCEDDDFVQELGRWFSMYTPDPDMLLKYHVYRLNSLFDLFSATVQEIANIEAYIKRCELCSKLYCVPNRVTITKYCSFTCNLKAKERRRELERKQEEEQKSRQAEWAEVRKRLAPMYNLIRGKLEIDDEEREKFFQRRRKFRDDILNGICTCEEFEDWMNQGKQLLCKDWNPMCLEQWLEGRKSELR
ncbi:MAG: hypothetical protein HDT37_07275 [Clostridiales bacterium]|nr:hypothetical protein [Clostridiales bacterium]